MGVPLTADLTPFPSRARDRELSLASTACALVETPCRGQCLPGRGLACFRLKTYCTSGPGRLAAAGTGSDLLARSSASPAVTWAADGRLAVPLPGLCPDWLLCVLAAPKLEPSVPERPAVRGEGQTGPGSPSRSWGESSGHRELYLPPGGGLPLTQPGAAVGTTVIPPPLSFCCSPSPWGRWGEGRVCPFHWVWVCFRS